MPTVDEIQTRLKSSVAVDNVILILITDPDVFQGWQEEYPEQRGPNPTDVGWYVLVISRKNPPYNVGYYCLPGGFVDYNEDPEDAAPRELLEETHLDQAPDMTLVGVYGKKDRDPRSHVISIAYGCILDENLARKAYGGDDALLTSLLPLDRVLDCTYKMGFDHGQIITDSTLKLL